MKIRFCALLFFFVCSFPVPISCAQNRKQNHSWNDLENSLLENRPDIYKQLTALETPKLAFIQNKTNCEPSFLTLHHTGALWKKSKEDAIQNKEKNRTSKILPYDYNRSLKNTGFYINSSHIITPKQEYHVMQAPLASTYFDFWRVVLYEKAPLIVCLTDEMNGRKEKSCPYWKKRHFPVVLNEWTVRFISEKVIYKKAHKTVVERKLLAINWLSKETFTIRHLHYQRWKDGTDAVPSVLCKVIEKTEELKKQGKPIVVHCTAGVGRAGSFVFAHSLYRELCTSKDTVNPGKTLALLRMQRESLLPRKTQFEAACDAAILAFKKKRTLGS